MSMLERWREWWHARAEQKAALEEMKFHIEQETEHNIQRGMSAEDARRSALTAFGGVDRFAEVARDERTGTRLADFKASWLDWKLGGRMLLKYPGLSIIGGLTLASAIALGAGWFELMWEVRHGTLPLDEGDRVVRIENWDAAAGNAEPRSVYDFLNMREQLRSIEQFGAYRALERNLITADGSAQPVQVAEISAAAFELARVPPLLGRPLTDADAEPGAPDVVVIGYDIWQNRFHGDPSITGRAVQLGRTRAIIVGVMPDDFRFPLNHQLWTPLRLTQALPRSGPAISMFGRLADDVSLETAQAELDAIGRRSADANPATHAQLRPRVLRYTARSGSTAELWLLNLFAWMVLAVACANVATLMFARTALRESEIVVRHALGASRGRVMGQLFVESLVLTVAAAVVALVAVGGVFQYAAAKFAADGVMSFFWFDPGLEPQTILYTGALAVVGAVLVGLLPALRATGRHVQAGLRNVGSGGATMQFGGMWSLMIVLQVAMSVLGLPLALGATLEARGDHRLRSAFDAQPYLTFRPELDPEAVVGPDGHLTDELYRARMQMVLGEVMRRLDEDPRVAAVTFADAMPGVYHPLTRVEVQRGTEPPAIVHTNVESDRVRMSAVDVGFFETFRVPLVAGRSFHKGDVNAANHVVIINESLAKNIGGNPVGARVRLVATTEEEERSPWYEVVGVVRNLGLDPTSRGDSDFVFMPASIDAVPTLSVALRVNGAVQSFTPQLRTIAAQVAPELRLYDVLPLNEVIRRYDFPTIMGVLIGVGVVMLVLMLSCASLFALMSVAVARRTHEIGIRLAIGASPRSVLAALFRRAATQVGAGIVIGNILVAILLSFLVEDMQVRVAVLPMLVASVTMALVGLSACFVPARRALAVQPTEALKGSR
jgi:putative ABC transport system permease protein